MAQQVMRSGLTICQCKELVLFPLLLRLLGYFIYLGSTSVSRVTCLRLQDLLPGRHTCRSLMGHRSLKIISFSKPWKLQVIPVMRKTASSESCTQRKCDEGMRIKSFMNAQWTSASACSVGFRYPGAKGNTKQKHQSMLLTRCSRVWRADIKVVLHGGKSKHGQMCQFGSSEKQVKPSHCLFSG